MVKAELKDQTLEQENISDKKSIEKIFKNHQTVLIRYACFYTRDYDLAEDMVQDVFVKLLSMNQELIIKTSMRSYLIKCVHNRCIDYLRNEQKSSEALKEMKLDESRLIKRFFFESGLSNLIEVEVRRYAEEALQQLPERTRNIFICSRREHLTNLEIARRYNITLKTVEYHITRALKHLRIYFGNYLVY